MDNGVNVEWLVFAFARNDLIGLPGIICKAENPTKAATLWASRVRRCIKSSVVTA
jgi:hypothetical protein